MLLEQEHHGSRASYASHADRISGTEGSDAFSERELSFISARDSFYLGTVSETGWPHVQHRGGPAGFVRPLNDKTLGWADFSGNRQYISIGNAAANSKVAMIFMDYAAGLRLKILGHMTTFEIDDRPDLARVFEVSGYRARIEHAILVDVEAFDWNCPQHITARFTGAEVEEMVAPFRARIDDLEAALSRAGVKDSKGLLRPGEGKETKT